MPKDGQQAMAESKVLQSSLQEYFQGIQKRKRKCKINAISKDLAIEIIKAPEKAKHNQDHTHGINKEESRHTVRNDFT